MRSRPSSAGRLATTLVLILALGGSAHARTTYHASPTGDDRRDGTTPATAWRTVARVNRQALLPGDSVLFERGGDWRGRLVASSDGLADRPITYAAYGAGPKPRLWGSDVIDKAALRPEAGGTFQVASMIEVYAVLVDHTFLRSVRLVTGKAEPGPNLAHLAANPGTWFFADGVLHLNPGVEPRADTRTYSAVVRDDVVLTNGKSHLVFRDLVVDETARYDAGYGFRVMGGGGVRLEGCEAYRCGKHHFGVINSTGFVGVDLLAAFAMPDQGPGGASAYVSYSDRTRRGDTSRYVRCVCEHLEDAGSDRRYPAFVTHGEGIGAITLEGLISRGGDVSLGNGESGAAIRVVGGRVADAGLAIDGARIVVDGMTVVGERAGVTLGGEGNVIQNMVIAGMDPGFAGHQAAIVEGGRGNTIRFCTVAMGRRAPDFDAAIALTRPGGGLRWYGNILATNGTAVRAWFPDFDPKGYQASFNLYGPAARFETRYDGRGGLLSLDRWRGLGLDAGSREGDPGFAAAATGDYALAPGSPAIDAARLDAGLLGEVPTDARGRPRLQGAAFDAGAYESPAAWKSRP